MKSQLLISEFDELVALVLSARAHVPVLNESVTDSIISPGSPEGISRRVVIIPAAMSIKAVENMLPKETC